MHIKMSFATKDSGQPAHQVFAVHLIDCEGTEAYSTGPVSAVGSMSSACIRGFTRFLGLAHSFISNCQILVKG